MKLLEAGALCALRTRPKWSALSYIKQRLKRIKFYCQDSLLADHQEIKILPMARLLRTPIAAKLNNSALETLNSSKTRTCGLETKCAALKMCWWLALTTHAPTPTSSRLASASFRSRRRPFGSTIWCAGRLWHAMSLKS